MRRHVDLSVELRAPYEHASAAFLEDGSGLLVPTSVPRSPVRRLVAPLRASLGGGAAVDQEVEVSVGAPVVSEAAIDLPIGWTATSRRRLFPAFVGHLELRPRPQGSALRLVGRYIVPFDGLGAVFDAVVGRRVAQRTLTTYVRDIRDRLDRVVAVRTEVLWPRTLPPVLPGPLGEQSHPRRG